MLILFQFPTTEDEWICTGQEFERKWNFPNCLGAVDGKHVKITPPQGSGSYFWNYKSFNSLVLMAIANANYEFIYCDIGTNGRVSDGGVIENTTFYNKLLNGNLSLPSPRKPEGATNELPYVFVGDEAFALRKDFLKPFSQRELTNERRIYNYRLSRARRVIENVFGIMASRFRIFHTAMNFRLDRIEIVVLACCVLHNFLRRSCNSYAADIVDEMEENLNHLTPLQCGHNRHYGEDGKVVRNKFLSYFNEEGQVPWQNTIC